MNKKNIYVFSLFAALTLGGYDGIAEQVDGYGKGVKLVKSWNFSGKEYSLVKFPYLNAMIFCILKESENGPKVILSHMALIEFRIDEPSMDVVVCDDFWALMRVDYLAASDDVGKSYHFNKLELSELEERERKAEAWDPDRSRWYRWYDRWNNPLAFELNSERKLPVRGYELSDDPHPPFIHQVWKLSCENGELIARPVGPKIRRLSGIDFCRYDSDKDTWTPNNRNCRYDWESDAWIPNNQDEPRKPEPNVQENTGENPPESGNAPETASEGAHDSRLVFGAGAAVVLVLAAGTGIFLWRRRRGKRKA